MTKLEFLAALEAGLSSLSPADKRKTLEYYAEMIDDRIDDGLSEEAAVKAIGSLQDILSVFPSPAGESRPRAKGMETKTFSAAQPFRSIRIETIPADIAFVPSDNGSYVVCRESDNLETTVTVENGVLFIQQTAKPSKCRWFRHFDFSGGGREITLHLAETELDRLDVKTLSGDVNISAPFCFANVKIESTSGDVDFAAAVQEELKIKTISGDMDLEGVRSQQVSLQTVSGDLELENVQAGSLSCKTVSGDIDLNDCDAASITLSSTSGDVEGTLLSEKCFTVRTVSGDKHVPSTTSGGKCDISTVSGDVNICMK